MRETQIKIIRKSDTTTYLLKRQKLESLTIPSAGEGEGELPFPAGGNGNGTTYFGKQFKN